MKLITILAAGAALAATAPAMAADIVNLDGFANASLDGTNAQSLALAAGTYRVTFTADQFTAFSRFSSSGGCDGAGKNCVQGWENSARFIAEGVTYLFGDGQASGGLGPQNAGDGYYATAAQAFANSAVYATQFTLASAGNVDFFIYDDFLGDNRGGISLNVAAVPEPATWAMMIGGFGLVGGTLRRRQAVRTTVRFA